MEDVGRGSPRHPEAATNRDTRQVMAQLKSVTDFVADSVRLSGRMEGQQFGGRFLVWQFAGLTAGYLSLAISSSVSNSVRGLVFFGITLVPYSVFLLPIAACAFRRAHDAGFPPILIVIPSLLSVPVGLCLLAGLSVMIAPNHPTWYSELLLTLLAVFALNIFALFYFGSRPSQPGPNRYGPNPNEVSP